MSNDNQPWQSTGSSPHQRPASQGDSAQQPQSFSYGNQPYANDASGAAHVGQEQDAKPSWNSSNQPSSNQYSQPSYGQVPGGQPYGQGSPQEPVYGQQGYAPAQSYAQPQQQGQPTWPQQNSYPNQQMMMSNGQPMAGAAPKSKIIAAVLCFFLGQLGIHNFYLGNNKRGIIQLIMGLVGWATVWIFIGGFVLAALGIWLLLELIFILTGSNGYDRDAAGIPLS